MRLLTFSHAAGVRLGVMAGDEVVDINAYAADLPRDMKALIGLGPRGLELARGALDSSAPRYTLEQVRLCAPVATPQKVFGIGMNFSSFLDALKRAGAPLPPPHQRIWFTRPQPCVVGPHDDIWLPNGSAAFDWEGEVALVIGRRCRHVAVADARAVIAGYTICNDMTVRDWAARCPLLGKSFDTHAPMGPWLVTADEIDDPHDLTITTTVNGAPRQHGSTAEMLSNCYELIAELSAVATLEPGDIILTGTPDGCAVLRSPPDYLRVGDVVRIEVSGLGAIANTVIAEIPVT